jgi:photosystem II stability/assembly factor-like uncharacterized protein
MKLNPWMMAGVLVIAGLAQAQPPSAWRSVGPGGGGSLFAPSWSPFSTNELYMACDMSEQFHSLDAGASWSTTPFTRLQVGRDSPKVQFTNDPLVLYMIDFTNEVQTPVKSTDGGATWTHLPGDPTEAGAWNILADYSNSSRVLVSDYSQLYFSGDGGATFSFRYQAVSPGTGLNIGGAFFDGNFIALGTNDGLLVSTDGGSTFAPASVGGISSTQAMVSFAGAKTGGTTRFFCVTLGSGDVYPGVQGDDHSSYRGVYKLDWGAANWASCTSGIAAGHHPFFVDMARDNISIAYLAGGSTSGVPIVYKTTGGGSTWQSVLLTTDNQNVITGWQGAGGDRDWSYGELAFGFDVHPTDPNSAAFTDMGFVHLTSNGGTSWHQGYVSPSTQNPAGAPTPKGRSYLGNGLENTSSWGLGWVDANTLWACFSDIRGVRSGDGGNRWNFDYTGHTANTSYQVVVHPTTHVMYLATSSVHDIYQSTHLTDASIDGGTGNVLFSTNNGGTWQALGNIGKPVMGLSLDPVNPNWLYAGVANSSIGGIYVCKNISSGTSATWTHLANPPRTQGHALNVAVLNDGCVVCTFSGRRAGSPQSFTASSGVFYSTDGGQTWLDRSHSNMLYWTKDITIDPHDADQNTWYVGVFSGWGGPANDKGGLYRTTNRGQSWTRINDLSHVESCAISPLSADELYFTTEQNGLWYTNNLATPTPTFTLVASYPFRQPERVFFNPFRAGEVWVTSFGHGLRVSQTVRGDCDGTGALTPDGDIPCFIDVLLGTNPDPGAVGRSDINGDGHVDAGDIEGFVDCLLSGCP